MLTRIVNNSPKLCAFFDQLKLQLSQPQGQHLLNMADALLVCEDTKTLVALQRQFVEALDPSKMADFLRISLWKANAVRDALCLRQVSWLLEQAACTGAPKVIYINLDDSLGEKDKHTCHLEPVDWFHDHCESTRRKPRFKNGFCYLVCPLRIGKMVVTVDLRLYLREKTVRRLNRPRLLGQHLPFRSKSSLARFILESLRPLLPKDWQVYVQFDSWYASVRLIKYVHRQGWNVTGGLKCNRKLNGLRLDQLAYKLRHWRYMHLRVTAADGNKTTYYVRDTISRLNQVPFKVRGFFSKQRPSEKSPAYIKTYGDLIRRHRNEHAQTGGIGNDGRDRRYAAGLAAFFTLANRNRLAL